MVRFRIKFFVFILFILCTQFAGAQFKVLADSISIFSDEFRTALQAEKSKRLKPDSLYQTGYQQNRLQFTQKSMILLVADSLQEAARLSLQYGNDTRNYKLPTEAYITNNVSLYSEGLTTIGKAKVMGKFYFDKMWEDSLANNMSGQLQNGQPLTYLTPKAGKYERQNLRFEAGIAYPVWKSLYLNALVNYNYHWTTGSVDPRVEEKIFDAGFTPGFSYKIGNTVIGAGYLVGKKDGKFDIDYNNTTFATGQLFPERRYYINQGYGYVAPITSITFSPPGTITLQRLLGLVIPAYNEYKVNQSGLVLSAAMQIHGWSLKANYTNELSKRNNFNKTTVEDTVVIELTQSRYDLVTQKLQVLITSNENKKAVHQLSFSGIINEGTSQMAHENGANYLFDEHNASLAYLLSIKKRNQVTNEFGLDGDLFHFFKKDYKQSVFYENTHLRVGVNAATYLRSKENTLKIFIKPGLVLPVKNAIQIPQSQLNIFTQNIAYPEYDFYGSIFISGRAGATLFAPGWLKNMGSAVFANVAYQQKISDSDVDVKRFLPVAGKKNQLQLNIGFQVFL